MRIDKVPFGKIEKFNVLIEIPHGSKNKYEYNPKLDAFELNFAFQGDFAWPFNYGEIFGTLGGDGDKLDCIVVSSNPIERGTIVACRAIGMSKMLDRGEQDDKIFAVLVKDPGMEKYQDIHDLGEEFIRMVEDFYGELALQKNKIIEIQGFLGKKETEELIQQSMHE